MQRQKVTIYIHGTLPPAPVMRIPLIHAFFFCPPGLSKATTLNSTYHLSVLARSVCPSPDLFEHFYFFGWSGYLQMSARKKAASDLNKQLAALQDHYLANGITPHFTLITHSHGGNVALFLAEESPDFLLDELVLLACPVQKRTEQLAFHHRFTQVFSIHSHRDLLQVIDPQGLHGFLESLKEHGLEFTLSHLKQLGPLFSSRHFPEAAHIIQLNIKHQHRELLHIEFLLPEFIALVPSLIDLMKEHKGGSPELTYVWK